MHLIADRLPPETVDSSMRLRRDIRLGPAALRQKEWWFGYAHDEDARAFVSWSFVRSMPVDQFRILVVDLASGEMTHVKRELTYLEGGGAPAPGSSGLSLRHRGEPSLTYVDVEPDRAQLLVEGLRTGRESVEVDLEIIRIGSPFTRRQHYGPCSYELLHRFTDRIRGRVRVGNRTLALDTRTTYTDHCFGFVPRTTTWQWIAACSTERASEQPVALSVLQNHGPHAQRYAQVLVDGTWHRLGPVVDVEYDAANPLLPWRVTSSDLDLEVTVRHAHHDQVRIPPMLPLLVHLRHDEFVVTCDGTARIGGTLVPLEGLRGVAELHSGRW